MTHSLLAKQAQIEWDERLASARARVAARKWSSIEFEARLLPWLAIALTAGAEPAEAAAELEAARREPFTAHNPRAHVALDCCPPAEMRAELTRARDAAVTRALALSQDRTVGGSFNAALAQQANERSTRLQYLALYLGCPPRAVANDDLQEAA